MISYAIRKFYDYYFKKIDKAAEEEILNIFTKEEKDIYDNMSYYDKMHGIEVYKKIKDKTNNEKYYKFSVLHDCGKIKVGFLLRVLHKLGFKTRLLDHPKIGYELMKNIDNEIATLILKHHDKKAEGFMKIFKEMDDRS